MLATDGAAADLTLLLEAAQEAGAIAMSHFGRSPAYHEKPGGAGPVSEADLAVDAALRDALLAARPDYGWLSEETADTPERLSRERVFIVDPIDGTKPFLAGKTGWGLALAAVWDGVVVAGVMHMPALGATFAASLGGGATRNGEPIAPSGRSSISGAQVLCSKGALQPARWPAGAPSVEPHFRPALVHRLCLVAEGAFDAVLSFGRVWEWDVASGSLIAAEAGCTVTDASGAPLRFNTPDARGPGILAATPAVHGGLIPGLTS